MFDFFQSQAFYVMLFVFLFGGMAYGLIRFCLKVM
jgi:hypothetical protein